MSAIQLLFNECSHFQRQKQNFKYKNITRKFTVKRLKKVSNGIKWQRVLVQLPL